MDLPLKEVFTWLECFHPGEAAKPPSSTDDAAAELLIDLPLREAFTRLECFHRLGPSTANDAPRELAPTPLLDMFSLPFPPAGPTTDRFMLLPVAMFEELVRDPHDDSTRKAAVKDRAKGDATKLTD
jgi:hypothetical protein